MGRTSRNVTLESLRSNVGVVAGRVLFFGSVYENIAYGTRATWRGRPGREEVGKPNEFIEGLKRRL